MCATAAACLTRCQPKPSSHFTGKLGYGFYGISLLLMFCEPIFCGISLLLVNFPWVSVVRSS